MPFNRASASHYHGIEWVSSNSTETVQLQSLVLYSTSSHENCIKTSRSSDTNQPHHSPLLLCLYLLQFLIFNHFICSSRFCLDNQRSLDRDQAFVKLQSRLIRYETQTTCSKEPCALPFALSPAPSPAVMSEPGSVPDGETLQNADVARLKRRSWDTDVIGGYPRKRYGGGLFLPVSKKKVYRCISIN